MMKQRHRFHGHQRRQQQEQEQHHYYDYVIGGVISILPCDNMMTMMILLLLLHPFMTFGGQQPPPQPQQVDTITTMTNTTTATIFHSSSLLFQEYSSSFTRTEEERNNFHHRISSTTTTTTTPSGTKRTLESSTLTSTELYERQVLLEFYQAATNAAATDWYNSTGWSEALQQRCDYYHNSSISSSIDTNVNETHNNEGNIHVCEWYGIQCTERSVDNRNVTSSEEDNKNSSEAERVVIGIQLAKNNIILREIPSSLYTLQSLQYLNLHSNVIYNGNFPMTPSWISPIEYIDLSDCNLLDITGISTFQGTLRELHLSRNHDQFNTRVHFFNRTINTTTTTSNGNSSSTFPHEILQLTNLQILSLSMNHIQGTIPYDIGQLSNLQNLDMNSNAISGMIPTTLRQLTKLQYLNLGDNLLSSQSIHDDVIPCSDQLRVLNIQGRNDNSIHTPRFVPTSNNDTQLVLTSRSLPSLLNCTSLQMILLGNNYFTGTIPSNFLYNTNAGYSPSSRNNNNPDSNYPSSTMTIQPSALTINLMNNFLTGTIPFENNFMRYDVLHLQLIGNSKLVGPIEPDTICTKKTYWMNGLISKYGCDAILCPPGTYNSIGQQVSKSKPCLPCSTNNASSSSSMFLGQNSCDENSNITPNIPATIATASDGSNITALTPNDLAASIATEMSELRILAEMYLAFDGPTRWNNKNGWNAFDTFFETRTIDDIDSTESYHLISHINHCDFYGILCTSDGNVERITLSDNNLVGIIPITFFYLQELTSVDFSYNRIRFSSSNDNNNDNTNVDSNWDDTIGMSSNNNDDETLYGFGSLRYSTTLKRLRLSHTEVNNLDNIEHSSISLTELYLDGCELSGMSIPTALCTMTSLTTLHLEASYLTGTIPSQIGKLTNLQRLNLNENSLTGIIPTELGLLTDLEDCDLSDNQFRGDLPSEISSLNRLLSLRINSAGAELGGSLPSLSKLSRIEDLELALNAFTGTIPNDFLHDRHVNEKRLKIRLTGNLLVGTVPLSFGNFSNLVLELEDNEITSLPKELCQNPKWMDGEVGRAMLSSNPCDAILCPSGTYSAYGRAIINDGINCTQCAHNLYYGETVCENEVLQRNREVEVLDLLFSTTGGRSWTAAHTNWTKAGVPICYREGIKCGWKPPDMNSGVSEIHLNNFGLRGEIPSEIYELSKLRLLSVSFNPVNVPFHGIEKAPLLEVINVAYTDVKSVAGIEKASSKLLDVHIAGCGFESSFPSQILSVVSLQKLFLEDNRINGPLPTAIGNLTNLCKLGFNRNDIAGTIPTEIGLLTNLDTLDMSLNRLSGFLPTELGKLTKLISLNLAAQESYSKIAGPLYPFNTIPSMLYLNVSQNALVGKLPTNLLASVNDKSTASITIDLSYNSLTGSIPIEFETFDKLNLDLAANMISSIPPQLCSKTKWMNGIVGVVLPENQCNAILCHPGSYNPTGRQMHRSETCTPCANISEAPFYGSVICQNPVLKTEREALIQFAELTGVDSWTVKDNWLSDFSVCTWYGVDCDSRDYVIGVRLEQNGLNQGAGVSGNVMDVLNGLQNLKVLSLDGSNIKVDFTILKNHSALEVISLNSIGLKSLKGIQQLENLNRIVASDNSLSGLFPEDLFSLTNLVEIFLSGNKLRGNMPSQLFTLAKLETLLLQDNQFSGTIPTEIGNLKSMKECILSGNFLKGSIPSEMSDLSTLERLSLRGQHGNQITGNLPDFRYARQLWFLDLSQNSINGTIPKTFLEGSQIEERVIEIILDDNKIEGTVPDSLGKFARLDIRLSNNMIESIAPALCSKEDWMQGIVRQIGAFNCDVILCPQGYYAQYGRQTSIDNPCIPCKNKTSAQFMGSMSCLDVSERDVLIMLYENTSGSQWKNNSMWLSDSPICSWYGVECEGSELDDRRVTSLDLTANDLVGTIISELWELPFLGQIILRENHNLVISFESLVDASSSIASLDLAQTRTFMLLGLSGLRNLRSLTITGLTGPFPSDILGLRKLETLDISNCYLVGTLPPQLGELTQLMRLAASWNDFHGQVPRELVYLSNLEEVVLDENLLSGTLSTAFAALQNLKILSISRKIKSGRRLSGNLPSLDRLPELQSISFYGNDFSGTIPERFLSSSLSLQSLDLMATSLTGTIPDGLTSVTNILVPSSLETGEKGQVSNLPNEREILQTIFVACGGSSWFRNDFWNTKADVCEWYGVGCSKGRVVLLNLENNNVTGYFPPAGFYLKKLQLLWLGNNLVTVTFANIRSATDLLDLKLYNTSIKAIASLGDAVSLTRLDLGANNFDDKRFPVEILRLRNLRVLSMANNFFTGQLPASLNGLQYLRSLDLSSNKFNGTLPSWSSNVAINTIRLNNNEISGQIPNDFLNGVPSFASLSIYLSGNNLEGSIPLTFARFDQLVLDLHDNLITSVPTSICEKPGWNNKQVGKYGCDGVLCPPGTTGPVGRKTDEGDCRRCSLNDNYYGQSKCSDSYSPWPGSRLHGIMLAWSTSLWLILDLASIIFLPM